MVMSPVDIEEPDLTRYPLFSDARRVQCSLRPGDVLFMPAFWWHEVRSQPDPEHRRNLAVNFWYNLMWSNFLCVLSSQLLLCVASLCVHSNCHICARSN